MEDLRDLSADQLRDELARLPARRGRLQTEMYDLLETAYLNSAGYTSRRGQLEELASREKWITTRLSNLARPARPRAAKVVVGEQLSLDG
jgi:hypothetical protein